MAKKIEAGFDLGWISEQMGVKPREPDEFTASDLANDVIARGGSMSASAARNRLHDLKRDGKVTSRPAVIDGIRLTLWRRVAK